MISYMWNLKKQKTKSKLIDSENKLVVARGVKCGGMGLEMDKGSQKV